MKRYREVDSMPHCVCCGILVPCLEVRAVRYEKEVVFCSERCIGIFDEYKSPEYGVHAIAQRSREAGSDG